MTISLTCQHIHSLILGIHVDWWSRADAPPPSIDAVMAIDYVKITQIGSSTTNAPTSQITTAEPSPSPSKQPTNVPTHQVCVFL